MGLPTVKDSLKGKPVSPSAIWKDTKTVMAPPVPAPPVRVASTSSTSSTSSGAIYDTEELQRRQFLRRQAGNEMGLTDSGYASASSKLGAWYVH